jgi:hypothetical protein
MIEEIGTFVARDGFDGSTRDPDVRAVAYDDPLHADVEGVPAQFLAEIAEATAAVAVELEWIDARLPGR